MLGDLPATVEVNLPAMVPALVEVDLATVVMVRNQATTEPLALTDLQVPAAHLM